MKKWRVGSKVKLNVYEGDRPICQCHTIIDARRIVKAMNRELSAELLAGAAIVQDDLISPLAVEAIRKIVSPTTMQSISDDILRITGVRLPLPDPLGEASDE